MKKEWKVRIKKAVALAVAAAAFVSSTGGTNVPAPGVVTVEAATVKKKSFDMAIAETLKLDSKISGKSKSASYTFKSSKEGVASVSKKGVVTAKKAGKTLITITEVKNGKKKTVGTVKVTVHQAEHNRHEWYFSAAEGRYEKYPEQLDVKDFLNYVNPKATYTWSCKNPKVITITKKGKITHIDASSLSKDGKSFKWGWIDLVIKETYKGKSRKITWTVRVAEPGLEDIESGSTIEVKQGEIYNVVDHAVALGTGGDFGVLLSENLYQTEQEAWDALKKNMEDYENDGNDDDSDSDDNDWIFEYIYDKDGYWTREIRTKKPGKLYAYFYARNLKKDSYYKYVGYYGINITN